MHVLPGRIFIALMCLLGATNAASLFSIASCAVDFKEDHSQGFNGWHYGYTSLSGEFSPYSIFDSSVGGENGAWLRDYNDQFNIPFWGSCTGHPFSPNTATVLRYVSPLRALLQIRGSFANSQTGCGDGVTARILVNNTEEWTASDSVGIYQIYNLTFSVDLGTVIQFEVWPGLNSNCDTFYFGVEIFTPRPKIRVMSDLHIGSPFFTNTRAKNMLTEFLIEHTLPNTDVWMLVLIGDILELWQHSFDETPLMPLELLNSPNRFGVNVTYYMDLIRKISANDVRVVWVLGNHDMEISLDSALSDFFNGTSVEIRHEEFVENHVRYEHGHRYDLFNRPDPAGYRPFGYYPARASATSGFGSEGGSNIAMAKKLGAWKNLVTYGLRCEANFNQILKGILNVALKGSHYPSLAGWTEYENHRFSKIIAGDYRRKGTTQELRSAKNKYKGLVERTWKQLGKKNKRVSRLLRGALGDYRKAHEHLSERVVSRCYLGQSTL